MNINKQRKNLLEIAVKIKRNEKITKIEIENILNINFDSKESKFLSILKNASLPVSVVLGITLASFPGVSENLASKLSFLNLPDGAVAALDYIWGIIGNTVEKNNLIYHVPNIILYSFGVFGIKTTFENINKSAWKDKVIAAQEKLEKKIENGQLNLSMPLGSSVLFVGGGDFIGEEFVRKNTETSVIISSFKQDFTDVWNKFDFEEKYEKFKKVMMNIDIENVGEYIFFPVIDEQIYLPDTDDFDLAPHKLDIIIQNIRSIEKELDLPEKRIIIVGDRYHESSFLTVSGKEQIPNSQESVTIEKISRKYNNILIIDPTDLVSEKINKLAGGRKVFFRASNIGVKKYKERFFKRLYEIGYSENSTETMTIGYDLFEDLTEQQSRSLKEKKYIPVVLSGQVLEALGRSGFQKDQMIYVPDLVLDKLQIEAEKQ